MKTLDFTTLRKGSKSRNGKIAVCPACNKKGALKENPKFDIYIHSQEYTDSSMFRHIHEEQNCKVDAPIERVQLFEQMCLMVGGERPTAMVNHHFWKIWFSKEDNISRLVKFRDLLHDKLWEKIDRLKANIVETDIAFQSIRKTFYQDKSNV